MYYLDRFYQSNQDLVVVTPEQASGFAKEVSDDFNPLHNVDNKRFCVPGDLLFAITLAKYGLSQKMNFKYTGMVGKGVELVYPSQPASHFVLKDTRGKECLNAEINGNKITDLAVVESFTKAYVAFSGHSFPHILVPLMKEHQVMINVARPMVIYESMSFEFNQFDVSSPSLILTNSSLEVNGKRGLVRIVFDLLDNGLVVGTGKKTMVLSGLRDYEEDKVQELVSLYADFKKCYKA
jgi:hypothetical protein